MSQSEDRFGDLGPLPRDHARSVAYMDAERAFEDLCGELVRKHRLTTCEVLLLLNGRTAAVLRLALRRERHPGDPSRPADAE